MTVTVVNEGVRVIFGILLFLRLRVLILLWLWLRVSLLLRLRLLLLLFRFVANQVAKILLDLILKVGVALNLMSAIRLMAVAVLPEFHASVEISDQRGGPVPVLASVATVSALDTEVLLLLHRLNVLSVPVLDVWHMAAAPTVAKAILRPAWSLIQLIRPARLLGVSGPAGP